MNSNERKVVTFRLISAFLILLSLGFVGYVFSYVIMTDSSNKVVSIITCVVASLFMILEIIGVLYRWRKESYLYRIAFNNNETINNIPLIPIGIFFLFGTGLIIMGSVLNVTKDSEPFISTSLIVIAVGLYVVLNCFIYYLYVFMYKKREVNLKDLIK